MSKEKSKKNKKQIVSDVIFSVFMTFLGIVILLAILQKTTGISIAGTRMVWVLSPSMEPTIPQQSYILVKDCKAEDVHENDIIMFISDDPQIKGKNNTHRVFEVLDNGEFVTKGDNNLGIDKYHVRPENVLGKYERNLPFMTFIGRFYATPAGFIVTSGVVVGLLAIWFAIDVHDRKKQSKQEYMDELVQKEIVRLENEMNEKEKLGREHKDEESKKK